MANNLTSYNRFTTLPNNISKFGQTLEEIELQQGKPDADPAVSPMPSTESTNNELALNRIGSDKVRLHRPLEPQVNPYEGSQSNLSLSRGAATKLRGEVAKKLQAIVSAGAIDDPTLQKQMCHSLQRVAGLAEFLEHQNNLTDRIYAQTLSISKG